MPIVEWKDTYKVGIAELDHDHQHLVGLLNSVHDHFTGQVSGLKLACILDELSDCLAYHFTCEERLMAEFSYPRHIKHKAEHHFFMKKVHDLEKDCYAQDNLCVEILYFLLNWFNHHVLKSDAVLGSYINSRRSSSKFSSHPHPMIGQGARSPAMM